MVGGIGRFFANQLAAVAGKINFTLANNRDASVKEPKHLDLNAKLFFDFANQGSFCAFTGV